MSKLYKPTQAVLDNIQRGIALKSKFNRQSVKSEINKAKIEKSKESFDSGFTLDVVKSMYSTLQSIEKSVDVNQRLHDGGPTEDTILWYAHGGNAGLAWSRMVLKDEGILKSFKGSVSKEDTEKEDENLIGKIPVAKSVNEELKQATFVVMAPNEVDLHGDITSTDEVRKACHNFNKFCQTANLFHLVQTESFEFCESYIAPTDMVLGDKIVVKGTWLATVQCLDDGLWELIKSGEINGLSIGAVATVETLEEEDGN